MSFIRRVDAPATPTLLRVRVSPSRRSFYDPTKAIWESVEETPTVGIDVFSLRGLKLRVGGLPDLSHAALAQQGGYVVVPEAGAGTKRHGGLEAGQS
jgi:hypothetical protein